jgi:hypothetical protein
MAAGFDRRAVAGLLATLVVVAVATEARLVRRELVDNVQVAEAHAWWQGRLDLPERQHDTAEVDGLVYSHFPPAMTILAWALIPIWGGVPGMVLVLALLAVAAVAYGLLLRRSGSPVWAAGLTIGLVVGTSLWPVMNRAINGASPYYVNHALAALGMLVLLTEYFGRRRVWLAGLGFVLAAWSRQLTIAYALPLLWMAWRERPGDGGQARSIRLAVAGACVAVVVVGTATLNALKFGNPLDSGYARIYEGRTDQVALDAAEHGVFSVHFVPRNLYYANIGLPRVTSIEVAGQPQWHVRPNLFGTGIWWTTPLLVGLWLRLRAIWRSADDRVLLLAAAAVFGALMLFHNTGWEQRGFNRFSLDYVPALFVLAVPPVLAGRTRWWVAGAVVWSVVYFRFLT